MDFELCHPAAGHVITGNLKIISDSRIQLDILALKDLDIDSLSILTSINVAYKLLKA